jgi:hypothetical protein
MSNPLCYSKIKNLITIQRLTHSSTHPKHLMHSTNKIGSFLTLRANGWSLDKIAKHINVSKGTVWSWDVKHQAEIHLLKHMQLERVQEQYLPSYEEELKSLALQLTRVEEALAKQDLVKMGPAFLMQTSLQIRDRLSKMRQQAPLRTVRYGPIEPLPVTGCVTKDEHYPWTKGDPTVEDAEDAEIAKTKAADTPPPTPTPSPSAAPSASTNGKRPLGGRSNGHSAERAVAITITADGITSLPCQADLERSRQHESSPCLRASVVGSLPKTDQNRPKTPGGQNSDRSASTTSTDKN